MFLSDKVKLVLLEELAQAQAKNPAYSMRAFAKRIGVSQAAISQILADKRPLTQKTAEKILRGLDKSPQELIEATTGEIDETFTFKSVDLDSFHLISEWYHFAILSLAETEKFDSRPQAIAKRLGLTLNVTNEAIALLLRLDMLNRDPKTKKLTPTGEQFEAISPVANSGLKKASRQDLDLAQMAFDNTEYYERDFTAMTLCFDPTRMEEARKMIRNFRRTFCRVMESKNKKEVYRLNIQLFPLTRKVLK